MSVQTQIERLEGAKTKLKNKGVELGVSLSTDKLDEIATKFETIVNRGAINATVKEGETVTIPKGYHNGSGVVAGTAGGGDYTLQEKIVTPTKAEQNVVSDEGYYGLSGVVVNPIPAAYQDVSGVTATAADVLKGKSFVPASGIVTAGTMNDNGVIAGTINGLSSTSFSIPEGHTLGGTVTLTDDIENALADI